MAVVQPVPSQNPNIDMANTATQVNPGFVTRNPQLAADGIQSGDINTFNTLAATSHMVDHATALDDHIKTYNSASWFANIFKDTKEVANALTPTVFENIINRMAQ